MRPAPALLLAAALAVAPLVGALALPAPASASVGSVPPAVRAYVTGGGLAQQLDEQQLDDTITTGPISRVFRWTDARLAGDLAGKPVRMANEWAVPVTVGAQPFGVAIVALNLDTGQPELLEVVTDAEAAAALATVPDDAELVRDVGSGAWFALVGDTATPLAPGDSGVVGPTNVDALDLAPEGTEGGPAGESVNESPDAASGWGAGLAAASVVLALTATLVVIRQAESVVV